MPSDVYIALGANQPLGGDTPLQTLEKAVTTLDKKSSLEIQKRSQWYESAPIPPSGQSSYCNGLVYATTSLAPFDLLKMLQKVELQFCRKRTTVNAPRTLDLDIIAVDDFLCHLEKLMLPHPRMTQRLFVLLPLRDVRPTWCHPLTGQSLEELIAMVEPQDIEPIKAP